MKYTDETLFTMAICEYEINGKNAISNRKHFSNSDFYRFSPSVNFKEFHSACIKRIIDIDNFYFFKNIIKKILDKDYDSNYEYDFMLEEDRFRSLIALSNSIDGIISPFDYEFPHIYSTVKKNADKPFLLFYKGNISLLRNLQNNVAVIGLLNPDKNIADREYVVVKKLVERGMNIISGLAKGCDTIAHKACIESNGKTIAILPSPLSHIYPSENRELAQKIVSSGGLLISEYYKKPENKFESTKRFIARDRLQAMFSKAILLSASYSEGVGDSGSRHAMAKAEEYSLFRAMLYNESSDCDNPQFGLNREYHKRRSANIMTQSILNEMVKYTVKSNNSDTKQENNQYLLSLLKS